MVKRRIVHLYLTKLKGEDDWGRKQYRDVDTKRIYLEVNGVLHSSTDYGEPDCPISFGTRVVIVKDSHPAVTNSR